MNGEKNSLEVRAVRHAALADVARLQIVDLLVLGDRSPGELQATLGITSNLLAHHLGVLDRAGVISRSRSEGDRRRSYVRLLPDAFAELDARYVVTATRVVFVCTGNAARSPLAAALWARASSVPVASAGTRPAERISPNAVATAQAHGLDLTTHITRRVDELIADGDLIVTVCDRAHEELGPLSVVHWSVPNPARADRTGAYEDAYQDLARRVQSLAPHLAVA